MLNVHNLSVSFMGSDLFSGITFKLNKGDRIGSDWEKWSRKIYFTKSAF